MTDRWMVTIEAWPHSTGNGADADQRAAGLRSQNFAVRAEGMAAALELAEAIAQGMRTNPMVWRAPIVAIVQEQERQRQLEKPSATWAKAAAATARQSPDAMIDAVRDELSKTQASQPSREDGKR